MSDPETDLPLTTPTQQRILELGPQPLRLQRVGEHRYGDLCEVKLKDFGLAGSNGNGESDIEDLARGGDRLWLVGSHSLRRRKLDDEAEPLRLNDKQSRNAHVLGCLQLNGGRSPVRRTDSTVKASPPAGRVCWRGCEVQCCGALPLCSTCA